MNAGEADYQQAVKEDEAIRKASADLERIGAEAAALPPLEAMEKAVADLWTQIVRKADDHVVFYDHDLTPTRVRYVDGEYRIAWAQEDDAGNAVWVESPLRFDNPREAAFRAFQGKSRQ